MNKQDILEYISKNLESIGGHKTLECCQKYFDFAIDGKEYRISIEEEDKRPMTIQEILDREA